MEPVLNSLGQPIGASLPGWQPPPRPSRQVMTGRFCRLEPLDPDRHAAARFAAGAAGTTGRSWTYMPYGPFGTFDDYKTWMIGKCLGDDPLFFAINDLATGQPTGVCSYLRITPTAGSIEVGHLHYSPSLQRKPASTEAMFLMMERAFALGYRRYEWKCDSLNGPSRAAAERLGFTFEGIFRQATVYKGRTRDTAWFSIIDSEWPLLRKAFEMWLAPANFGPDGLQLLRLSELTRQNCTNPST